MPGPGSRLLSLHATYAFGDVTLGADIIGVNCRFDPNITLRTIGLMKDALDKEGLKPHLMCQPVGYHTPDADRMGAANLPEGPLGESRTSTKKPTKHFNAEYFNLIYSGNNYLNRKIILIE